MSRANPLANFTESLWHGSELSLSTCDAPASDDLAEALDFLCSIEVEYRKTLPAGLPPVNVAAVEWALTLFYRASQFLVFRELPEEMMRTELDRPCPEEKSAAICYSVDLSFRFLPELLRLTKAVNSQDPMIEFLVVWANEWPLSSVGVSELEVGAVDVILQHPALRTLYVDRILATGDTARLVDPHVSDAVRVALGDFRELSPVIYDLVITPDSPRAEQK